ncbi:tail fiber domain-containing protein [Lacihabitans soyangensis]|uniref:Tail fiber domain-containing protein n=1 Tax=Lacihabitans soyangensis TaxID=869394 RepID=A0AAE3KQY4_9BACT|nr:tail fiber domain-containing protein [Lacihabitans soyangensis]MCP9761662.1 tail fiber domain-containing protein [Lacihabitans soyangensis]
MKKLFLLAALAVNYAFGQNSVSILDNKIYLNVSGNQNAIEVSKIGMFGAAGVFEHTSGSATGGALIAKSNSLNFGGAFFATNFGTGSAGTFTISNPTSYGLPIYATTNGLGVTARLYSSNSSNNSNALEVTTDGNGNAGYFNSVLGNALITGNGRVGIGLSTPSELLDVNGRARIRHNVNTAGVWMSNSSNSLSVADGAFYGMKSDTEAGIYIGNSWRWWVKDNGDQVVGNNLGVGLSPTNAQVQLLNSVQNRKIVLYDNGPNNDHQYYGFGINPSTLRYQVNDLSGHHIFYAGVNATSSNELMRIQGSGNVGIGTTDASKAGLVVNKVVGATPAIFGDNTSGVGIDANFPGISFNGYYNGGRKLLSDGYAGGLSMDPTNGRISLYTSVSGTAGNVVTTTPRVSVTSNGNFGIGIAIPTERLNVVGNGLFTGTVCASNVTCPSDVRFKKNFRPLDNAMAQVMQVQGVRYDWRKDEFPEHNFSDKNQMGFVAQDLEKLFPEMVVTDSKGYKSVDYARITPLLVEALKEQQKIIDEMKTKNQKLESRLDRIEAMWSK